MSRMREDGIISPWHVYDGLMSRIGANDALPEPNTRFYRTDDRHVWLCIYNNWMHKQFSKRSKHGRATG
jgi:hypothetical protein